MERVLAEFRDSVEAYGQMLPKGVFTDNVGADRDFFTRELRLPVAPGGDAGWRPNNAADGLLPLAETGDYTVLGSGEINSRVDAMMDVMAASDKIVSLDAEWTVQADRRGRITGAGRVSLIQLAFFNPGRATPMVLLIHLRNMRLLPRALKRLFTDPTFTFVGRCVGADISRIGKDFSCAPIMKTVKTIDLGTLARTRDVVQSGTVSLEKLCATVLKQQLPKPADVRQSEWCQAKLTARKQQYAARDAAVGLLIYQKLHSLPDLTARITAQDAVPGVMVDLVPSNGRTDVLATYAGVGRVERASGDWKTPAGCLPAIMKVTDKRRLVEVHTVTAPGLRIPGLKLHGKTVTLRDLAASASAGGRSRFRVVLPIQMLAKHLEGRVRPTPTRGGGTGDLPEMPRWVATPPSSAPTLAGSA